jgi:hypothetical protein
VTLRNFTRDGQASTSATGNPDHAEASILDPEVTLQQAMLIDYIRMYQAQIDPASRSGQR